MTDREPGNNFEDDGLRNLRTSMHCLMDDLSELIRTALCLTIGLLRTVLATDHSFE
jgi:hypothetical protein